jgi:hypothetical protein
MKFKPETYWEDRCHVLEGLVERIASIMVYNLPACRNQVNDLMINWETILTDLEKDYGDKNETNL